MFNTQKSSDQILKEIETALSDKNVPNYLVIQQLKTAIKNYPENEELKTKLKIIESSSKYSKSSPKTLYAVLSISIFLMSIFLLFLWKNEKMDNLGLILGITFTFISALIFKQYLKEK